MGLNIVKRYALHMKPGCGPTVEGLLVKRTRREFVLMDAQIVESADRTVDVAGYYTVLRENVFGLQELS